jgi:hypothetical protein
METILHFDKLFYHFSHSNVTGEKKKKTRKESIETEEKKNLGKKKEN